MYMVCGKSRVLPQTTVKIYNKILLPAESTKHVGIKLHRSLKSSHAVDERIRKGRSSVYSLMTIKESRFDINPLKMANIVDKVSIPTALYGSELWASLTNYDVLTLERFLRFAAKMCQNLPTRTRTDMSLSLIGWLPIIAKIDSRKLMFFHKLCCMNSKYLTKQLFEYRLALFNIRGKSSQQGFIPDIYAVMEKYSLLNHYTVYRDSSIIPPKLTWKRIVNNAIRNYHTELWTVRVTGNPEFARFSVVHPHIRAARLWTAARTPRETSEASAAVRVLVNTREQPSGNNCRHCGHITLDSDTHAIASCQRLIDYRLTILRACNILPNTNSYDMVTLLLSAANTLDDETTRSICNFIHMCVT